MTLSEFEIILRRGQTDIMTRPNTSFLITVLHVPSLSLTAMAISSSPPSGRTASRDASTTTPMTYQAFKPKFPVDPFASSSPGAREPWTLRQEKLPTLRSLQSEGRVVLVLGRTFHSLIIFGRVDEVWD